MTHTTAHAEGGGDKGYDGTGDAGGDLFGVSDIPAEIWAHILASVDPRWRFCVRSVCRQWGALVERLPMSRDLDTPASKRRLSRGYLVGASAAASAYTGRRRGGDTRGIQPGENTTNDHGNSDDRRPVSIADDVNDADDHERARFLPQHDSEPRSSLDVDRILAVVGWTHDGTAKRNVRGLDIVIGLLHTGDEAAVDSAFLWLEARSQEVAACLPPSDPCNAYAAVGRVLARHARMDWMRRAERALVGFVARDHCSPIDALLSGDAAFAAEVNGTEPSRWYACAQVWETAGRSGAANVVRDLVAAAEGDAPAGTYQGLPPCLRAFRWHVWPSGAVAHPHGRPPSAYETCARIAARAAVTRGHTDVIRLLLDGAAGAGGLTCHANHERELAHLFDDAAMAASRKGVAWCLGEAARTSTFLDVVKAAMMAVTPIFSCADTPGTHRRYFSYGNSQMMGDRAKGKWCRGVRVVAWLRESGGLGAILDAPKIMAAVVKHAHMAKTQLALMLVYAPALASMYREEESYGSVHAGDDCAGGGGRVDDKDTANAVSIVGGVVRGACREAFLNGKIQVLERLIAALDVLARHPPLDHLVARVKWRPAGIGPRVSCVLAYAHHRAAGLGITDAANRAVAESGGTLQPTTPWTYEAPKTAWQRWWSLHSDRDATGGPGHRVTLPETSPQKTNGVE